MILRTVQLFVCCRAGNALIIQNLRDLVRTHSTERQCKNASYHLRRFRVDDKLSLGVRGFAVPIQCKGADEQPLPALVVQHCADIVGQVLQIPLVDQPIDLA